VTADDKRLSLQGQGLDDDETLLQGAVSDTGHVVLPAGDIPAALGTLPDGCPHCEAQYALVVNPFDASWYADLLHLATCPHIRDIRAARHNLDEHLRQLGGEGEHGKETT
jgi:hypothetical protein